MLQVLAGETVWPPPIWLMRQAGRYLPEYRVLRARYPAFLDLCYDTDAAVEVTLQPIRRYGLDAAILFSDILVIPDALGQKVWFEAGEGPRLEPISAASAIAELDPGRVDAHLQPVIATVRRLRVELPDEVALLGFCGAPWTVATYMVAGAGSPDQRAARLFAYRDADGFSRLIDVLVEASADYLANQLEAGADAVQVFDTWAGVLGDGAFSRWVVEPTRRLVDRVRARVPDARIIGFPRGAGMRVRAYAAVTGVDAVGLDWTMPLEAAAALQSEGVPVQGNLDPLALVAGGAALARGVDGILEKLGGGPLIFNLGHGVVPETPPEHVAELVARIRGAG